MVLSVDMHTYAGVRVRVHRAQPSYHAQQSKFRRNRPRVALALVTELHRTRWDVGRQRVPTRLTRIPYSTYSPRRDRNCRHRRRRLRRHRRRLRRRRRRRRRCCVCIIYSLHRRHVMSRRGQRQRMALAVVRGTTAAVRLTRSAAAATAAAAAGPGGGDFHTRAGRVAHSRADRPTTPRCHDASATPLCRPSSQRYPGIRVHFTTIR